MKRLSVIFASIAGLILVGLFILSLTLDSIVKSNIENITSEMLDTQVTAGNVSISLWDGTGSIDDFSVANPDDFSDEAAIRFDQISVDMELTSLLSDTARIKEVRIQKPSIFIEQTTSGNNLNVLLNSMEGADSSSDMNIIIDYLLIENGDITLTADLAEESTTTSELPRIELDDIGRDGNNTIDEVLQQILEPILEDALREAVRDGLLDQAKEQLKNLLDR